MAMSKWTPETDLKVLRRVGKTGEEASELLKVCCRIVIQGLAGVDPANGEANREALTKEIADTIAQCRCTIRDLDLDDVAIKARVRVKMAQMAEWEALFDEVPHVKSQVPRLLGWRTDDYLNETADRALANNWAQHYTLLPIFEGDPHTKLTVPALGLQP